MSWEPDSHWDDHPLWSVEDWKSEVAEDATRQSYISWVNERIDSWSKPQQENPE